MQVYAKFLGENRTKHFVRREKETIWQVNAKVSGTFEKFVSNWKNFVNKCKGFQWNVKILQANGKNNFCFNLQSFWGNVKFLHAYPKFLKGKRKFSWQTQRFSGEQNFATKWWNFTSLHKVSLIILQVNAEVFKGNMTI